MKGGRSVLSALALLGGFAPFASANEVQTMEVGNLTTVDVLTLAGRMIEAGSYDDALVLLVRLESDGVGGPDRDFLDGMVALARKDEPRAEAMFRRILAANPGLVRVRLELARTLFLESKDEEADYHFRLAITELPDRSVVRSVARYREAIRARRAWRFNLNLGLAPDTNVNSATGSDRIEILGLPFELSPDSQARSGTGFVAGADASLRLWRDAQIPIYVAGYGRAVRYANHDFDDIYVGGEAGPEFRLAGGRMRVVASGLRRWYGGKQLLNSIGGRLNFEKILNGGLAIESSLALRRNAYARREDVDGWDIEASLVGNRALDRLSQAYAFASIGRTKAQEPAQSNWQGRFGLGVIKELGWGLRPQLGLEIARQVNDSPLALFGGTRRDWRFQASASLYRRDWNVAGFAPSIRVTWTRNSSSLPIYDQKRLRSEFGLARAF